VLAVVVAFPVAFLVGRVASGPGNPPDRSRDAYLACRGFVRQQIPTPATAKFPPTSGATVTGEDDGPFVVSATVDAENLSGALVRERFTCTVTRVEGGWRLDALTVR
jgi:hypothetical protein